MKKTFRFLTLGFMLLGGTLSSFAVVTQPAQGPKTDGTAKVGSTVSGGNVVYKVTGWDGNAKSNGGTEIGAYTVEITGLDADGLAAESAGTLTSLTIQTNFKEKFGEIYCNYKVTKISDASISKKVAFYALSNLKSLTFVNDTETQDVVAPADFTIGTYAFFGCTNLATLTFPDNVSSIGDYAFQSSGISEFEIPANCKTIGTNAFNNCQKLEKVKVRNNVNAKGEDIGGELTALNAKVFGNSSLKELDLTEAWKLTTIGSTGDEIKSPFLYKKSVVNNQLKKVILPKQPVIVAGEIDHYTNSVTTVYDSFEDCTALTSIENLEISAITAFDADAFNNCQSLPILNFPVGAAATTMLTGTPFKGCAKLATLTFADGFAGTIGSGVNLYGTAAADLAALNTITFQGASTGVVKANAFGGSPTTACSGLTKLEVKGVLKAGAQFEASSFSNCAALATATFNGIEVPTTEGMATVPEFFVAGSFTNTALTSVNLGTIKNLGKGSAQEIKIGTTGTVFSSDALTSFTIGDITVGSKTSGGDSWKLTIGNSSSNPVAAKATAASDVLSTVTIGNITTAGTVTIDEYAFASTALATVTIGSLAKLDNTKTGESITIGSYAFDGGAAEETITIGDIAAATTINANAFTGNGTKFTATLGNLKAAGTGAVAIKIAGNAFTPKAISTVEYNIGDVAVSTSNIAAGAFVGGTTADGAVNTTVNVGAYQKAFTNWFTFTNVKDLTVKSWEAASYVTRIAKPVTFTVTGDITANLWGDSSEGTITKLTIGGNIKGGFLNYFGKSVRTIIFSGEDPEVTSYAFMKNSFEKASKDAYDNKESVTVTYKCTTNSKYNPIFEVDAFGDASIKDVVILYTTVWAEENIFKNDMVYPNGINRMSIIPSEITPATAPSAKMVAAKNGQYKYGRLYVPQGTGMYYKIDAKVNGGKNTVNLFSGHLDGDDIYMKQVDIYEQYYWIDANDKAQVFIVRTSDMDAETVTAEKATDAEIADWNSLNPENPFWFSTADAKKNCLRYATAKVVNQELQNNEEFKNKSIYVMANPAKRNLAFAHLNQYTTTTDLPEGSIYVISKTDPQSASARLNVIFEDEIDNVDNATGIQNIEAKQVANDGIYNLQGVRVKNAKKGIYIINGKKVIK